MFQEGGAGALSIASAWRPLLPGVMLCPAPSLSPSLTASTRGPRLSQNRHTSEPFPSSSLRLPGEGRQHPPCHSKEYHLPSYKVTSSFHPPVPHGGYMGQHDRTNLLPMPVPEHPSDVLLGNLFGAFTASVFSSLKQEWLQLPGPNEIAHARHLVRCLAHWKNWKHISSLYCLSHRRL